MTVTGLLLLVGSAATAAMALPQAWRIVRHGSEGVAVASESVRAVGNAHLVAYAAAAGLVGYGLFVAGVLATSLLVVAVLARDGRVRPVTAVTVALVTGVSAVAGWWALAWWVGAVAVVADLSRALPQAAAAVSSDRLEGVSAATWVLQLVATVAFAGYGAALADPVILAPVVVLAPASVVIVVRVVRSRAGRLAFTDA